ncbi:WXG100 family type VII secretion target [Nocardioides sp. NPDC006273]|uniref:WXG100 family type VII secretion target n=1 Tax=Nocardioides sp. NPDC006273 TaxID=3155598 RepID=UPI0033BA441E
MTVTYDKLQSWKPEQLDAAADDLNTARKKLLDQQDEMDAGKVPDTWIGQSATAAENRHRRLVASLNDMAAPLSQVINALDEASASIKKAKDNAEAAYNTAIGKGWKVTFSGATVQISDPTPDEEDPDKDNGTMDNLADDIARALGDAEAAESSLTSVLNSAKKGDYDGGDGSIEDASLPPELRNLSTDQLVKKMLEDPDKYDGYVDALSTYQQQELGRALADATSAISDPNDTSLYIDGDWKFDPDKVAKLNAMFESYGEHPVVSTAFLNDLGPEGLLSLNGYVARMQDDDNFPDSNGAYHNTINEDLTKQIGLLQKNLGETLSAGTEGLTKDGQSGTDTRVSSEWVSQLVAKGDDVVSVGYQGIDGSAPNKAYGYQVLAPLLRSADSGYLLNEVGDGMLDFETRFARDNGGASPWNFPITDEDGRIVGGNNMGALTNGPDVNQLEGTRLDWTGGSGEEDTAGWDPMGALLDGFSNNPDAARDFFDGPNVNAGEGNTRRVDYLLTDRTWPSDEIAWQGRPMDHPIGEGPTGTSALGDALKAATMDDSVDDGDRKQIGHLLDDIVTSTAQDNSLAQDSAHKTENPGSVDAIRPELRDDLGEVFGFHAETMHESMSSAREISGDGSFGPYGATYSEGDMRRFLLDLGKDPEAYETVRHAEYAETQRQLTADLNDGKADLDRLVNEHTGGMSDILGALDYGANKADILDTLTADKEHNDDVSKKAGIAREIAGLIPTDVASKTVPGAGWALDKGVSSAIDAWEQANLHDRTGQTTYDMGELIEARKAMAKSYIAEILAENGIPDGEVPGLIEGVETQYQSGYDEAHKLVNPA